MNSFWCVLGVGILLTLVISFVLMLRRASNRYRPSELEPPEIPTKLTTIPEPPKVFLDPLLMQLHGEHTELVTLVSRKGIEICVLVNSSTAALHREKGIAPFRQAFKSWAKSPAYCRCGPRFGNPDNELEEMALPYLYAQLLGDDQFDESFNELEQFWFTNATKFGYQQPKREVSFDFFRPGC